MLAAIVNSPASDNRSSANTDLDVSGRLQVDQHQIMWRRDNRLPQSYKKKSSPLRSDESETLPQVESDRNHEDEADPVVLFAVYSAVLATIGGIVYIFFQR